MLKILFIQIMLLVCITGCKKGTTVEPFNYERDTPAWLKEKVNLMSNDPGYAGTKVFRYLWNGKDIFYFDIPASSCVFCDVYHENGIKIQFSNDAMIQDFLQNRKNEVLVWEWKR